MIDIFFSFILNSKNHFLISIHMVHKILTPVGQLDDIIGFQLLIILMSTHVEIIGLGMNIFGEKSDT